MLMTERGRAYSSSEAAAYLGLTLVTLRHHIYKAKRLRPDGEFAGDLVFFEDTLDEFKRKYRAEDGLTIPEIAKELGVSQGLIKYHLYTSGKLQPDARRGRSLIFNWETVEALRQKVRGRRQEEAPVSAPTPT